MRASLARQAFLDFFRVRCGHTVVPSSPVVPHGDPTLLFTNAGMNQFKDVFLGRGTRPYTRAADTQKCIRAGGKHNDLEDVGKDVYHHTFFEMLGNWSFGDYFKKESIEWGWELLTKVYSLPEDRLYATYFGGNKDAGLEPDDEARALWLQFLPPERVIPGTMKDNFWEMGETGPCGPCSEIHFDRVGGRIAPQLVNSGDPDLLEIWNHVFIQFNREPDRSLKSLPAKHVDTGMGLERLVSVLQDKRSNYDTDLWSPIFESIRAETGAKPYGGSLQDHADIAYRIIADHIRCLTVAACDGAGPGADGRSYVLRRILRRAARHGRQTLGRTDAFLYRLVPAVVATLGDAFPEIKANASRAADIIRGEEEAFGRTIHRGIALFEEAAASGSITGEDAFKLHDTMGFPIDLTQVMAQERGLPVDVADYEKRMEAARERSRAGAVGDNSMPFPPDAIAKLPSLHVLPTDDSFKDAGKDLTSRVRAIWTGSEFVTALGNGARGAVIVDRTCFYAESGGQVADTGTIRVGRVKQDGAGVGDVLHGGDAEFQVTDTQAAGDFVLHIGHMKQGELRTGDNATLRLDHRRRAALASNHTATHLLNLALREVADCSVEQRGSLVAPDRLRFDYTAPRPLSIQDLAKVESAVNRRIEAGLGVFAEPSRLDAALAINGVRAVFGERYPDPVRVVAIGASPEQLLSDPSSPMWMENSIEFCGGTHVANTKEIGHFVLVSESALSAGIRRVVALSGEAAREAAVAARVLSERIEAAMRLDGAALDAEASTIAKLEAELMLGATARAALGATFDALRERVKNSRKANAGASRDAAIAQARSAVEAHAASSSAGTALVLELTGTDAAALLAVIDLIKAKLPDSPALLMSADHDAGKVAIAATCPPAAIAKGLKAGDWVKAAAQACGGGGGGRPDLAQAGGKDPSKVSEAMATAKAFAQSKA
ncbi:MAG: alanine--tRNA ligase [Planctomycetota bacterium]|nr:alanine--tRNA ligase [Planctomycetota bacterium]MDA1105625.1 alanine--tRNA ligase [Planctomycetota bacterium]